MFFYHRSIQLNDSCVVQRKWSWGFSIRFKPICCQNPTIEVVVELSPRELTGHPDRHETSQMYWYVLMTVESIRTSSQANRRTALILLKLRRDDDDQVSSSTSYSLSYYLPRVNKSIARMVCAFPPVALILLLFLLLNHIIWRLVTAIEIVRQRDTEGASEGGALRMRRSYSGGTGIH